MKAKSSTLIRSLCAALTFAPCLSLAVLTETNYDAQNFNTNAGYVRGRGIISTFQPVGIRWQGNDPYDIPNDLGETDLVQVASGYTPPPAANSTLIQGGLGVGDGVFPGTNNVQIWKTFTPSVASNWVGTPTVSFFAEWSIIPSTPLDAPYTNQDTFSFDLRNAANSLSLLKLQFTPGINIQPDSYTLQTLATGVGTNLVADLSYQALWQMRIDITGSQYNLNLTQIDSTNRTVISSTNIVTNASLALGFTALDLATISLDWELASGDNLDPGANYLLANQFQVTTTGSPVPEPSTWASAALLLIVSAYVVRRRNEAKRALVGAN